MGLKIVYGRAGTGKSNFCFQEIKEQVKKEKIYVITPEQFSFTAEKRLLEAVGNSSINAEVITFQRIAHRIITTTEGIEEKILNDSAKQILIYFILQEQKDKLNFLGKSEENTELLFNTMTELKKHTITIQQLEKEIKQINENYLKLKLQDIYTIYSCYDEKIKNNYLDADDLLTRVAEILPSSNLFQNSRIYIDEFVGFTPQEYKIMEILLKTAKEVTLTICSDNITRTQKDMFYSNNKTAQKLLELAKKNNTPVQTIFLEQTHRFNTQELEILEKNLYTFNYFPYKKSTQQITLKLLQDPYQEIENIAINISKKVREEGYCYQDIAVITKNIETYQKIIKAIFYQYEIPVFIDEKKDLSQNIFIQYVLSILAIFSKSWSQEAVFASLKTGFYPLESEEIFNLENYCIKWGIKGKKWYEKDWDFGEESEKKEYWNTLRRKIVEPLIAFKSELNRAKTVREITVKLYEFLKENEIEKKLNEKIFQIHQQGQIELSNEYVASMHILVQVLDNMVALLGEEQVSFEKYYHLLKIGCTGDVLGSIPATLDQVIVGNIDRTRTHSIKIAYVIGVNDGDFPSNNFSEGFLNDKDRIYLAQNGLELAKTTEDLLYEEQFNIYKAFSSAEDELHISYVSQDTQGTSKRPSILISKIKKLFPNLQEQSELTKETLAIGNKAVTFNNLLKAIQKIYQGEEVESIWYEIYQFYQQDKNYQTKLCQYLEALTHAEKTEQLSEKNMLELYGETLKTSVSRLEQYRKCPFSFYLKYGLQLKEQEELQLKTLDTGSFMHEVIDQFFEYIEENNIEIKQVEEKQLKEIVEKIVNNLLSIQKNYIFSSTPKLIHLTNRLKKVVTQSIAYIVYQLKVSDFQVVGTEIEFKKNSMYEPIIIELDNGKKVEVTGKIDRVDIAKDSKGKYLRIIDYKSSARDIDFNEVYLGLQLQLLTYMEAATKVENAIPAGALYFGLIEDIIKSNKNLSDEEIKEKVIRQFRMEGILLADIHVIRMMDKNTERGYSSIVPAYIDKDGNLSNTRSSVVTKEQFERLQKYTKKLIRQISKEILSGDIGIKPYYNLKTKKSTCQYCSYKSICNFNPMTHQYLYSKNLEKQEILEQMGVCS